MLTDKEHIDDQIVGLGNSHKRGCYKVLWVY